MKETSSTNPVHEASTSTKSATSPASGKPHRETLSLHRVGTRSYTASNGRGAHVEIGMGEGQFSPGDLLKIAVAGCVGLSGDHRLAHVLGEDFTQDVEVSWEENEEEDRYEAFAVDIKQNLSSLSPEALDTLTTRVFGAIRRQCTISHTLTNGAEVTYELIDSSEETEEK